MKAAGGARADAVIPQIIDGSAVIAFAYAEPQGRYNLADLRTVAKKDGAGYVLNGHKAVVYAAPWATHLIVTARTGGGQRERGGVSVFLVPADAAGITRRDYPTVDGARASEVYLENVAIGADALIGAEGEALPLVERIVDEATAAVCAEASGVVRKLHEGTLDYSRQRRQFGRPIGEFQVLQHRMVDMFMEVEQAVSMTLMATLRLAEPDRAKHVSAAKNKIRPRRALRRPERGPDPRRHRHLERARHRPLLQARDDDRERLRRRRLPPAPLRKPDGLTAAPATPRRVERRGRPAMRRLILACLVAAAPAAAAPDVDRLLSGTPAGRPAHCIRPQDIRGQTIVDQSTIVFERGGGRYWRSDVGPNCAALRPDRAIVARDVAIGFCAGELFDVFDPISRVGYGQLHLRPVRPLSARVGKIIARRPLYRHPH